MKIILIMITLLAAMQLIQVKRTNPPVDKTITLKASNEVMKILKTSCYDCHSNETVWPYYSKIAPLSWNIVGHVNDGRDALNFSNWDKIDPKIKIERLKRSIKTINNGMMPLSNYLIMHKNAKLSDAQKVILLKWCNSELKKR